MKARELMTPLRIHFFVSFVHPQGTYFRFHNLARGLAALGHDVHVYACDQDAASQPRTECRDGIPYSIVPVSRASRFFTAGADPWRTLTRGLTRFPPCDVAHLFQPFAVSALAWRRSPARARFWDWDDLWTHDAAPATLRPLRKHWPRAVTSHLEYALPRAADHVTAIDHYLLDLARSRGAKASSLLYNPSPHFDALGRAETRAQFGLDPDALYVGFMGYTLAELDWCFEAVGRNMARHPRLRFVLCGPSVDALPPMRPDVRARTDCLGRLPQSQARAVAGATDLALLPLEDNAFNRSRFPVKFSEYLMAGTPVLCSEIGECGLLTPRLPGVLGAGATRETWLTALDAALDRASAGTLPPVDSDAVRALFSSDVVCRGLAATYEAALSPATVPVLGSPARSPKAVPE